MTQGTPVTLPGTLTVGFWSRDGITVFLSEEFTAAVTVTWKGLCLKRQKYQAKFNCRQLERL